MKKIDKISLMYTINWNGSALRMLTVKANAKINLTLDILGKRDDGFHEVSMVMQSVTLHDTIELEKIQEGIQLEIDIPNLKADSSNLAWRAAELLINECHVDGGVRIRLKKRIPMAAGLAGGSADAAGVLRGVNQLYELGLTTEKLCEYGAMLGSDIPFCIMGGTMLATGRGEVLQELSPMPKSYIVLAKPPVDVSTAWAYSEYDNVGVEKHPDNELFCQELEKGNLESISGLLCNVLESVTIKRYEVISKLKDIMLQQGALASMMSGSGPTVFGIASSKTVAEDIAAAVRIAVPEAAVFISETASKN